MSRLGKLFYGLAALCVVTYVVATFFVVMPILWVILGLGGVFVLASFGVDHKFYREFLSMKTTKNGMNMGVLILLVVVLLVAVNILGLRHYATFDFSSAKKNSLSEQSKVALDKIKDKLEVKFFYEPGGKEAEGTKAEFSRMLRLYQDYSSKVSLEFVNIQANPDVAEKYGVNQGKGIVFVEYHNRKNRVDRVDEQEITNAILKTTREKDETYYFLSGHGEPDLSSSTEADGMGLLKGLLEGNGAIAKSLNLLESPKIPEDATAVFVVGPKQAVTQTELGILEAYLAAGGKIFLGLSSSIPSGLDSLVAKLGLKMDNNFIVYIVQTIAGVSLEPVTPAGKFDSGHPITKSFKKDMRLVLRAPQSLSRLTPAPEGYAFSDVVKSNKEFFIFPTRQIKSLEGGVTGQEKALMTAITGKVSGSGKEFRAVVIGESGLFTNAAISQGLNRDLVLNSASYLAGQDDMATITPREPGKTTLNFDKQMSALYVFGFIVPLPLMFIFAAGFLFFRRRSA